MTLTPEQENLKKIWLAQHELAAVHVAAYEKAWEEVRGGDIIAAPASIHMAKARMALADALSNCLREGFDPRNLCSVTPLPDFPLPVPLPEPLPKSNPCSEIPLPGSTGITTLTPPDPEPPAKPMTLTPEQENLKKIWLAQHELAAVHVAAYEKAWEEVRGGDIIAAPASIHMAKARMALADALSNCLREGFDPRNLCSVTPSSAVIAAATLRAAVKACAFEDFNTRLLTAADLLTIADELEAL